MAARSSRCPILVEPGKGDELTVVVVGSSGCGKSMLINSFANKLVCRTGTTLSAVTQEPQRISVNCEDSSGTCVTVDFIDTPGMTGRARTDDRLVTLLKEFSNCNAIACCFDIAGSSGRYRAFEHYNTLAFLKKVFGENAMREKAIIVLTKANELYDIQLENHDGHSERVRELRDSWKKEHEEEVKERGDEARCLLKIPVLVAGSAHFKGTIVVGLSKIDGEVEWYSELWRFIGQLCCGSTLFKDQEIGEQPSSEQGVARFKLVASARIVWQYVCFPFQYFLEVVSFWEHWNNFF